MTDSPGIVDFIRARLDEDEAAANSATSGPWTNDDPMASDGVFAKAIDDFVVDCDYVHMGPFAVHNATHIALHDPSRTLREVAAHRALLDEHERTSVGCRTCCVETNDGYDYTPVRWPCPTLRILASIWSDHPSWRSEWSVTE